MKSYSVFSLYVVKKGEHKFICKKSSSDTYIEFFTKEKIKIENIEQIESLSDYYPIIGVMDYKNYKPLMLNKNEILNKYIEINQRENENEITAKEQLDSYLIDTWEDYVESQKDKVDMEVINVKELIKKNKN